MNSQSSKITKSSLKIKNKQGDILFTDFRSPESSKKLPLVIFCHGFKGFKDWGAFPYIFDTIASQGFFVVSFNFSYNGTGEKESEFQEFTRLNLFAENTFSRELDDAGSLIDYLEKQQKHYNYDFENLTIIGHSRGGGIAILKAGEDRRIKKLITLASVSDFYRYSEAHKKKWKEKGYFEVMNARTKQMMRLNYTLVEDLEKNADRLNIEKAISRLSIPVLIIHGEEDLAVDYSNAQALYSAAKKHNSQLILLPNTGHTFGAVHPYNGTTPALEKVLSLVINFLKS